LLNWIAADVRVSFISGDAGTLGGMVDRSASGLETAGVYFANVNTFVVLTSLTS